MPVTSAQWQIRAQVGLFQPFRQSWFNLALCTQHHGWCFSYPFTSFQGSMQIYLCHIAMPPGDLKKAGNTACIKVQDWNG